MIRVMIVATYSEIREGLATLLRLAGDIEVTGAASPESAIQLARTTSPDIALIDLEMPEGKGYQTIRQLRRLSPDIKVIALTSHDYPSARESALRVGAKAVFVKGMDSRELVAALMTAVCEGIEQHNATDEADR